MLIILCQRLISIIIVGSMNNSNMKKLRDTYPEIDSRYPYEQAETKTLYGEIGDDLGAIKFFKENSEVLFTQIIMTFALTVSFLCMRRTAWGFALIPWILALDSFFDWPVHETYPLYRVVALAYFMQSQIVSIAFFSCTNVIQAVSIFIILQSRGVYYLHSYFGVPV